MLLPPPPILPNDSLQYVSIEHIDASSSSVTFNWGGLQDKNYYTCSDIDFSCNDIGTTLPTSTINNSTSAGPSPFDVILDVPRVSNKAISPDGRFIFYYQDATNNTPTRSFVLVDNKTGGQSKITENVNYWDLLTEENRLFSISPDSKTMVYLDDRSGYPTLYKVDLSHPSKNMVTGTRIFSKNYSVSNFIFLIQNQYFLKQTAITHLSGLYIDTT